MIQKPLNQITNADIESLVSAKVSESRTLDYKQQLPDNDTDKKREFLYDVSSFANAAGGDMIFGVADERDVNGKATGLPASVEGFTLSNVSDVITRLENLVRDGITPRIQAVQWQVIEGFPSGSVLVVRIPKSLIGPHMVVFGGMARFYSRNSTGKYPMDYREIRSAFVESTDIGEKLQEFRANRITEIINGSSWLGQSGKATVVLHLVPLSSLGFDFSHDVARGAAETQLKILLEPIRADGWDGRFNFDGYLVYTPSQTSYVQVFRSGIIEAANNTLLDIQHQDYKNMIPGIAFEKDVIEAIRRYLRAQNRLAILPPIFIAITLFHVKGFRMSYSRYSKSPPIDRSTLMLPETLVEDYDIEVGKLLRPSFDALWQACGLEKSLNYDDEGNWKQHHQ